MTEAALAIAPETALLPDLLPLCEAAAADAKAMVDAARTGLAARVTRGGRVSGAALEAEQTAAHGLAWMATYAEALREMAGWARGLTEAGAFGETEALILQIASGEYLAQLSGGIPMSQVEIVRPADVGVSTAALATPAVETLIARGNTDAARARLVALMLETGGSASYGATGLDEDYEMVRDQFRRFADDKVVPFAHEWHLKDELIPMAIIEEMGALGVFGLTIPEEYGGAGMSKTAMCVVSEELSRGYIGVGSLGTRSEIAAELILGGGTEAQKEEWLPKLASAEILPTAVFTEPNTGSDLGSLRTRAVRDGDSWVVTGNKTWITHAARADVMTMLVRTDPSTTDYSGLSMLLAPKPRGTEGDAFPATGMSGGEIEVLGYRGMKEYELGFDGFKVPVENLLGGVEGQGFKQLMRTFESARIQTAARAIGVAQCALELGLQVCAGPQAVRQAAGRLPAGLRQAGDDGGRDHGRSPAHLLRRTREGRGPALRSRGRHGEAAGRPHRVVERRQRVADPRRQRIRARVPDQPGPLRRPDPVDLRGSGGNSGTGDRAAVAGGESLRSALKSGPAGCSILLPEPLIWSVTCARLPGVQVCDRGGLASDGRGR